VVAGRAVKGTFGQLVEGITYIREHRNVGWSLSYMGITGALIGVLAVLGPDFARTSLGLGPDGLVVIVLPLGLGIVTGILAVNAYGHYFPRRRIIESGLIVLGLLLAVLSCVGSISHFFDTQVIAAAEASGLQPLGRITSLLSIVVAIAFIAGVCYAVVAISAQTQLQEELPEDVRGRVFGILNMLVSVASLLPIMVVGPAADLVGSSAVLLVVSLAVCAWGVTSVIRRGRLQPIGLTPLALPSSCSSAARGGVDLSWSATRAAALSRPGAELLRTSNGGRGFHPRGRRRLRPTLMERPGNPCRTWPCAAGGGPT
jgi:hypothetical protein